MSGIKKNKRYFKLYCLILQLWGEQIKVSKPKTIVVMRNPKDQMVSQFHFVRMQYPSINLTWDQWFENFKADRILYGGWADHVTGWWRAFHGCDHVIFLKYEDMKNNIRETIEKLAAFLEKELTEDQVGYDNNIIFKKYSPCFFLPPESNFPYLSIDFIRTTLSLPLPTN